MLFIATEWDILDRNPLQVLRLCTEAEKRKVGKVGLTVGRTKLRFHDLRHVFATWLLRTVVSLDAVREFMGQKDRPTTDRYVTLNRMEASQHLKAMPRIVKNAKKNTPTKNKSKHSDTNRHKRGNEHMLYVSEKDENN